MQIDYDENINLFIKCINETRYFDAHEALEEIWFPRRFENNDEIKLIKGFINAAVSFELLKRGRLESSKKVWKNYLKYKKLLETLKSPYMSRYLNLSTFLEQKQESLVKNT